MPYKFVGKPILFALGCISFILGIIGAFLPILPTTPFIILSAFLFSKSSPRVHRWLLELPKIGPAVKDWEENKTIRPEAKLAATLSIVVVFSLSLYFAPVEKKLKLLILLIGIGVLAFIWSRPSFPPQDSKK